MPGQRRFVLFVFIGIVLVLSFWPTRRSSLLSSTSHVGSAYQEHDKDAEGHAVAPPAQPHPPADLVISTVPSSSSKVIDISAEASVLSVINGSTQASTSRVIDVPTETQTSAVFDEPDRKLVPSSVQQLLLQTSVAQTKPSLAASHNAASSILYTASASSAAGHQEEETQDAYAYLTVTTSVDEFAYLTAPVSESAEGASATPETTVGAQDAFAYLSESSSVDEYAYLTATSTSSPSQTIHASEQVIASAAAALNATHTASAPAPLDNQSANHHAATGDPNLPELDNWSKDDYASFQDELHDYPLPKYNVEKLRTYTAHNYRGPGHNTYATFLSTRNSSLQDPYFLATLQQAYRLLWHPRSMSEDHPFTVYVAPYIPEIQRDYLAASGAIVRELELIAWEPKHPSKASPRLRPMFSKLNFWNETEYSRILYLDSDAFPLQNIDELFEMADTQHCNSDRLPEQDRLAQLEICDYTLLAASDKKVGGLNAGMIVLSPNRAMHKYLLRESIDSDFDQNLVEQGYLNYAFRENGPFPVQLVNETWNAISFEPQDESKIKVIHEKLWATDLRPDHFASNDFRETWTSMLKLYDSPGFGDLRAADAANAQAYSAGITS